MDSSESVATSWLDKLVNPSAQILITEYLDCKEQHELLKTHPDNKTEARQSVIALCDVKMAELENALQPGLLGRRVIAAWTILHRLHEEMFLLMPKEQLYAEGKKLIQGFNLSALPDSVKSDWVSTIQKRIVRMEPPTVGESNTEAKSNDPPTPSEDEISQTRQVFKMASNVINDFTDDLFWDITTRNWISFVYVALLFLVFLIFFFGLKVNLLYPNPKDLLSLPVVLSLGIIGGLTSGLLSGERESFAKGHFWTPTFYYAMIRPAIGIMSALIMFWALQGQLFVKVEPSLQMDASMTALVATASPSASVASSSAVVFASPGAGSSVYLYMLLLFVAAFSGDKLLKNVADKVMARLFTQAEKNKDASTAGTGASK